MHIFFYHFNTISAIWCLVFCVILFQSNDLKNVQIHWCVLKHVLCETCDHTFSCDHLNKTLCFLIFHCWEITRFSFYVYYIWAILFTIVDWLHHSTSIPQWIQRVRNRSSINGDTSREEAAALSMVLKGITAPSLPDTCSSNTLCLSMSSLKQRYYLGAVITPLRGTQVTLAGAATVTLGNVTAVISRYHRPLITLRLISGLTLHLGTQAYWCLRYLICY